MARFIFADVGFTVELTETSLIVNYVGTDCEI